MRCTVKLRRPVVRDAAIRSLSLCVVEVVVLLQQCAAQSCSMLMAARELLQEARSPDTRRHTRRCTD